MRDHKAIDSVIQDMQATMLVGKKIRGMSTEDVVITIVRGAEDAAGREATREEIAELLLASADWYDQMAAACRRYAAGPQLRIVPPPTPEPEG